MNRDLGWIFCAVLVSLVAPVAARAQTGTIQGRVADEAGAAVVGALVAVEGTDFGAVTDSRGAFTIEEVPAGPQTIRVQVLGFESGTQTVTVPAGGTARADLTLAMRAITVEVVEVIVGSRARHTAAEELAVPVDVYTSEDIQLQGTSETAAVLEELSPSVNFPRQSVTDATDIVRPFTLRGLSPDHTLVLVNGKRRHRTALVHIFGAGMGAGASGVDLNALPVSAIERIEVLRDGAAAQYGSDAIAGVVNVVLKDGVFDPTFGASVGRYAPGDFEDDGTAFDVNGSWGVPLGDGSLGLFLEYRDRDATNRAGADPVDQIVEGDADVVDDEGNVIEKRNPVPQPNHHWGDGKQDDILAFANLAVPLGEARAAELYAFGGYSFREGQGNGFRRQGIDDRNWPEIYPLGFLPTFDADVTDGSGAAGFRGEAAGWRYDFGANFGYNAFEYNLTNTLNTSLGPCLDVPCAPGLDGVLGTADDPGIPNQTDFTAGELKLNEFVVGGDITRVVDLGFLPQPLNVALGAAFRREGYEIVAGERASWIQGGHPNRNGDLAPPGSQVFPGFQPTAAIDESRTNFGVYGDFETNLTPEFLANVAARFESYDDFGERLTGKLALRYQPDRRFVMRGAVSTGFRAPALSQNFYSSTVTNFRLGEGGVPVPFEVGIFRTNSTAAMALGAQSLDEETSVNVSAGFAATPIDALTFTADVYFIRIDDRIILTSEIGGDEIVEILRNAGVESVEAARFFTNAIDTETRGVDLTATYEAPAGPGTFTLSGGFNYTDNEVVGDVRVPPELEGTGAVLFDPFLEGGLIALEKERPKWRGTLEGYYETARWSGLGRASFWGPFTSVLLGICGPDCVQEYDAEVLLDAEVGYRVADQVRVAIGAKNIFDNFPERMIPDNSFGIFLFPSASPFGFNGRYVYARTEISFGP
ncbi:MAG: TonB-dependent receptor domain-containing protein [Gemmatimonadota bacterium]